MLRNPIKRGTLLGGLAVATLLAYPAPAQNPTAVPLASNVPPADVRARMWAATARFVYGNDPDLAALRPQLLQTIDSSSVKAFGHSLDNAVRLEKKAAPKQGHMLKFQELFKLTSTKSMQLADLPTNIANALLENKPTRRTEPAFIQLRNQLHLLADPNAPVPTPAPAAIDTPAVAAPLPAAAAPADATATSTSTSTPMLTYLALALSVISLLVALFKGNSRGRHRHSAAAAPSLSSLTDEMRAEVRTMVQREVGKLPAARPAPDAPAKPTAQPVAPAAPKAAPATPPAPQAAPIPTAPAPAPAPQAAAPAKPAVQAPTPEPASAAPAPADDFFTVNYPVDAAPAPAAVPTRTLYANQQPLNGEFQRNSLADAPASYTIFELTSTETSPDQAQFVVTGNPAGHAGYIGSHQNILGGACTYSYPKGGVSRIVTEVPGTAQRTPGGDWQITQKAQIRFE